jgi:hypothetical protein
MSAILEAPCVFCAYSSRGYWQVLTHDEKCPWRHVAGSGTRTKTLRDVLISRSTPPVAQEPVAWQGVHEPWDLWTKKPQGIAVRALYAAPPDARNAALEEAARVCDQIARRTRDRESTVATMCAAAVRGLKGGG